MPLISQHKELKFFEKRLFQRLVELYENDEHKSYLFHDIMYSEECGSTFKPDFIILDPKRGICVIEAKGGEFVPLSISQTEAVLESGEVIRSPIEQARGYFYKIENYLKSRGISCDNINITPSLFLDKVDQKIENVNTDYLKIFYKSDFKSFSIDELFSIKREISHEIVEKLKLAFNPVFYFNSNFSPSSDYLKHNNLVSELENQQLEVVTQRIGGHHLVTGIPGSGKSIAALARAVYVHQNNPDWKILVVCFNKKLKEKNEKDLKDRTRGFAELGLEPDNIECSTFHGILPSLGAAGKGLGYVESTQLKVDKAVKSPRKRWDYIIVDEYQDFQNSWLKILKDSCREHICLINGEERLTDNFFFVGDRLQQLNGHIGEQSWKSLGINIVSTQSKRLKSCYRSSSNILKLALSYLTNSSKTLKDEVEKYYDGVSDIDMLNNLGGPVQIEFSNFWNVDQIKEWIQKKVGEGAQAEDFLIIHPDSKMIEDKCKQAFREEIYNGIQTGKPSNIKGIESKFVILWQINNYGYKRSAKDYSKIIYMCMTRAGFELYINSSDSDCTQYLKLISCLEDEDVAA